MNAADALRWALHALSGVALALSISLVAVGTRDALRGRPAPQLPVPDADAATEAREAPAADYESIAQRGLFEPLRARAAVPDALPTPETTLQLELLGTIYSSAAPERSLAVVRDLDTRETHVLCVGMSIGPAQVLEIHSRALLLSHDGNTERLALRPLPSTEVAAEEAAAGEDGAAAADTGAAGEVPGFGGSGAAAVPEPNVPPPDAFDAAALAAEGRPPQLDHEAALRALSQQVRFVPQFSESGGLRGVQLSGLDPSGSLWRAGFREGDVIVSVDGLPFEAPGALETLRSLPLDSGLQVDLERAGTPLRIAIGTDALQF